jgi:hypothetical protein
MKHLGRVCAVLVLMVVFSLPALAGDILIPGCAQPQSKSSAATTSVATEARDLEMGDILIPGVVLDPATEAALGLLQSLPSLF